MFVSDTPWAVKDGGLPMKTWVFASQKGGCGKSALATQIAAYAQSLPGEKVAIIDIDPQRSAVAWSTVRGNNKTPQVVAAHSSDLPNMVASAPAMGFTLLIIDTAPHTKSDTVDAIRVADLVICPTKPALFELEALKDTVAVLTLCKKLRDAVGVVNCVMPVKPAAMVADYDRAVEYMTSLGLRACAQYIGLRKAIVDAIDHGAAVTETSKGDKAAREIIGLYDELKIHEPVADNIISMKGRKS